MTTTRWQVLRQDDNGNVYIIAEAPTETDAYHIARLFEARAHEQMYWVEPISTAPAALPYR